MALIEERIASNFWINKKTSQHLREALNLKYPISERRNTRISPVGS